MSQLIRRNEMHRRRARRMKLGKLRLRYGRAKTNAEKEQIVQRAARVAPTITREQFLASIKAAE